MSELHYDDVMMQRVLKDTRTIAMAGASPNWVRPSNFAMKYLLGKGYKVHPINPGHAGKEIWDQTVYASLADIPGPIDMLDIFRNSAAAGDLVDEAISLKDEKQIKIVWLQLGVINHEAAARAEAAGLIVIMDRCPKIEYGRLFGELGWSGVNSGIISSKKRPT
ncbi:CoA-binding protein [Rhodospirillales bacterium]|nr:CoA-binding protein [Rhodospirillales bacterium]